MNLNNLYTLTVFYMQEYPSFFLDIFSLVSIISSILVIVSKNPIVSVLFLICLFIFISMYLILLGLNFIGLSYLLVYIGAVSILFLFILMLINIRISEIHSDTSSNVPLTMVLSIPCYIALYNSTPLSIVGNYAWDVLDEHNLKLLSFLKNKVNFMTSYQWDSNMTQVYHITSIGNVLYTSYFILLILVSIILLLAMVGSIIITIKPKQTMADLAETKKIHPSPFFKGKKTHTKVHALFVWFKANALKIITIFTVGFITRSKGKTITAIG